MVNVEVVVNETETGIDKSLCRETIQKARANSLPQEFDNYLFKVPDEEISVMLFSFNKIDCVSNLLRNGHSTRDAAAVGPARDSPVPDLTADLIFRWELHKKSVCSDTGSEVGIVSKIRQKPKKLLRHSTTLNSNRL